MTEAFAEKPANQRRKAASPPPNLDLFGDLGSSSSPETAADRAVAKLGPTIRRLQLKLRVATDKSLGEEGLTTAQYGAMQALEKTPGATSAELARTAGVTAQTMHEIVRLLTARGWIERTQDPEHGRKLTQQLSAAGRKALGGARRRVERVEDRLAAPLKPHERVLLQSLLERCAEGI